MDILKFESFGGSFAFFLISLFASFKIKKKLEMFLENSSWFSATWIIFVTFGKIQFHCLYFWGTTYFMCIYLVPQKYKESLNIDYIHPSNKTTIQFVYFVHPCLLVGLYGPVSTESNFRRIGRIIFFNFSLYIFILTFLAWCLASIILFKISSTKSQLYYSSLNIEVECNNFEYSRNILPKRST